MNRRSFVALLATGTTSAQSGLSVAVTASSFRKTDAVEGATKSGIRAVELDGASVSTDLVEARALRNRFAKAGLLIRSIGWKLSEGSDVRARLTVANALDVRYVSLLSPAALAPSLNAESIRMGVPVALRNGGDGFRTADEIVAAIRPHTHLGLALDARQMLADGHDPAVFLRRASQRVLGVYLDPELDATVLTALIGAMYARKLRSAAIVDITKPNPDAVSEVRRIAALCAKPPRRRGAVPNESK